jgi:hypothetical protein
MGGVVLERLSAATDGRTGGVRADGRVYYRERVFLVNCNGNEMDCINSNSNT